MEPWLEPASSWALPVLLDSLPVESCSLELSSAAWREQGRGQEGRTVLCTNLMVLKKNL